MKRAGAGGWGGGRPGTCRQFVPNTAHAQPAVNSGPANDSATECGHGHARPPVRLSEKELQSRWLRPLTFVSLGETFDLLPRHERRNVEQRLRNLSKERVAEFRLLLKDASFLGCLRLCLPNVFLGLGTVGLGIQQPRLRKGCPVCHIDFLLLLMFFLLLVYLPAQRQPVTMSELG